MEKNIQKRIAEKLRFYIVQSNPLQHAKKLKDSRLGTYRFRIGNYRVVFDIDDQGNITILIILRIKHRKEVYL
ncbi:type II toxin-antitoxin system RelE/ParE family toxin [Patescibacteria group bacterium]|nr:type II toxin-antitoxin system RelE/ParE family toxin [Patescibacteria group bacterium]